jgi:hypothetical protein
MERAARVPFGSMISIFRQCQLTTVRHRLSRAILSTVPSSRPAARQQPKHARPIEQVQHRLLRGCRVALAMADRRMRERRRQQQVVTLVKTRKRPGKFIPLQQLRGQRRGRGRAAERFASTRVKSSKSEVRAPAARACATMAGTCPK